MKERPTPDASRSALISVEGAVRTANPGDAAFIHVAVIYGLYLDLILSGQKTIESRLSLTRRDPFGKVLAGERIYFKERSGSIRGTAVIEHVLSQDKLSPQSISRMQYLYNDQIIGPAQYWTEKATSRYATLLWLKAPEPVLFGPDVPRFNGNAWIRVSASRCVYPACLAAGTDAGSSTR